MELSYLYHVQKERFKNGAFDDRINWFHQQVENEKLSIDEAKEIVKIKFVAGEVNAQITSPEFMLALATILEI